MNKFNCRFTQLSFNTPHLQTNKSSTQKSCQCQKLKCISASYPYYLQSASTMRSSLLTVKPAYKTLYRNHNGIWHRESLCRYLQNYSSLKGLSSAIAKSPCKNPTQTICFPKHKYRQMILKKPLLDINKKGLPDQGKAFRKTQNCILLFYHYHLTCNGLICIFHFKNVHTGFHQF